MTDWESQVAEFTNNLIVAVESGERSRVQCALEGLSVNELHAVAASAALGLLRQEGVNETLAQSIANMAAKNRTLETANVALFQERRKLTDALASVKEDRMKQAGVIARLKERKAA